MRGTQVKTCCCSGMLSEGIARKENGRYRKETRRKVEMSVRCVCDESVGMWHCEMRRETQER